MSPLIFHPETTCSAILGKHSKELKGVFEEAENVLRRTRRRKHLLLWSAMQIKMVGMGSRLLLACFAMLMVFSLNAQQKTNAFDSLVHEIEGRTEYKFFYDPKQTANIEVDPVFNMQDIPLALKQMLQGTGLYFPWTTANGSFITRSAPLLTTLPSNYFKKTDSSGPIAPVLYEPIVKKEVDATLENRVFTIGSRSEGNAFILSGYIRDSKSGEPLAAASIVVDGLRTGVATDAFWFFIPSRSPKEGMPSASRVWG